MAFAIGHPLQNNVQTKFSECQYGIDNRDNPDWREQK